MYVIYVETNTFIVIVFYIIDWRSLYRIVENTYPKLFPIGV